MYVVSLTGKNVFQHTVIICAITKMSNLVKVRNYIKQKYDIEFEELYSYSTMNWFKFDNRTDDRDISLIVEDVYTEDDIDIS